MLLDRREGFSGSRSEVCRNLAQDIQDVFLACRSLLLVVENVAGAAVLRPKSQNVLTAKAGNRTFEDSRASSSLADVLREFGRHSRV